MVKLSIQAHQNMTVPLVSDPFVFIHHPCGGLFLFPQIIANRPVKTALFRHGFHFELMLYINAPDHTLSRRALSDIVVETFPGLILPVIRQPEQVVDIDTHDLQHVVHCFDITRHYGFEPILKGPDLLSGQHRGQCAHHSAADRTNDMVKRGGMLFFGRDIADDGALAVVVAFRLDAQGFTHK